MMLIDTKFKIGDSVFLITDTEQKKRMVTGYCIRSQSITYLLSCGHRKKVVITTLKFTEDINILTKN